MPSFSAPNATTRPLESPVPHGVGATCLVLLAAACGGAAPGPDAAPPGPDATSGPEGTHGASGGEAAPGTAGTDSRAASADEVPASPTQDENDPLAGIPSIEELEAALAEPPPELAIVTDPTLRLDGDPDTYPMASTVGGAPVEIVRERHPSTGVLLRIKTVKADSAGAESGPVLHGPEWTYFDTAAQSSVQWWKENVAHGPVQQWWRVGTRKAVGRFKDGERDGLRREYAKNGQLKSQGVYKGGVPVGVHEEWFPSGQRMRSESYLNGALHGPRKIWDRDGLLVLSEHYDHGLRHGKWSDFYPGDGDLREWGEFTRGERTGLWRRGSEDGVILEAVHYVADRRHGLGKVWNAAGNLIEEVTYVHGARTGPCRTWYDDGVLQSEGQLEDNLRTGYWSYHRADGTPNELWSGEYSEDQRVGPGKPPGSAPGDDAASR